MLFKYLSLRGYVNSEKQLVQRILDRTCLLYY